jgi:hypothetical protein
MQLSGNDLLTWWPTFKTTLHTHLQHLHWRDRLAHRQAHTTLTTASAALAAAQASLTHPVTPAAVQRVTRARCTYRRAAATLYGPQAASARAAWLSTNEQPSTLVTARTRPPPAPPSPSPPFANPLVPSPPPAPPWLKPLSTTMLLSPKRAPPPHPFKLKFSPVWLPTRPQAWPTASPQPRPKQPVALVSPQKKSPPPSSAWPPAKHPALTACLPSTGKP